MQYEHTRLTYDETATMLAAMADHPECLVRERIGAMEYVTGDTGAHRVVLFIDSMTGESIRLT